MHYARFNKIYPPEDIGDSRIEIAEVRDFFLGAKGCVSLRELARRFGVVSKNGHAALRGVVSALLMQEVIWPWPGQEPLYANVPPERTVPQRPARRVPTDREVEKVKEAATDWIGIEEISSITGVDGHLVRAALREPMERKEIVSVTTTTTVLYRAKRRQRLVRAEQSRRERCHEIQGRVGEWSTASEISSRLGVTRQRVSQVLITGLENGAIVMSTHRDARRYAARTLVEGGALVRDGMKVLISTLESKAVRNGLAAHGLQFLGEVARMREPDVASFDLGRHGLQFLANEMARHGLHFGMDIPDWLSFPLLAQRGWTGIEPAPAGIEPLHLLEDWMDARAFAGAAGMSRGAATRMLNRLVSAGKVQRVPDIAGRILHALSGVAPPSRRRDDLERAEGGLPSVFARAGDAEAKVVVGHLLETRGRLARRQMQELLDPMDRRSMLLIRTLQRMSDAGTIFVAERRGAAKIYSVTREVA